MDLMKMLAAAGGGDSIAKMASQLGVSATDAGKMIAAVAPALKGGLQKQVATPGGLQGLQNALQNGHHDKYLKNPELMAESATREDGNRILGHLLGSKDVSRAVASDAAAKTGIDPSLIKKALPLLAGLAMGAMSKSTAGAAKSESDGGLAAITSMLGGDGGGLGNLVGLAKKLF
ncbi:MAG: DUF937 domain-containing protein [Woeseia sp.]|nr:DUF937 domain-containing protein [Woeseia sp.]